MLGGSGVSVQWEGEGDPVGYAIGAGDCLVHRALENAHTLQAGPDGLDVLAFGQRTFANGITWLPRAGVAWLGETWAPVGAEDDHPWAREAAVGPPEVGELSPRPSHIVHVPDLEAHERDGATVGRRVRFPGREAGAVTNGHPLRRGLSREAERPAALPLARGGDLRRPRGRRPAPAVGGGRRRGARRARRLGGAPAAGHRRRPCVSEAGTPG